MILLFVEIEYINSLKYTTESCCRNQIHFLTDLKTNSFDQKFTHLRPENK